MRIFGRLYERVLQWSKHRHASYYLAFLSFIDSSLVTAPPALMWVPMSLSKPERVWRYTNIVLIFSILGALFAYMLGLFFFHLVAYALDYFGYMPAYYQAEAWFAKWGGWVMFVAGLAPVPFRLFTVGAGALHLPLLPFVAGTVVSRSIRFYLIGTLLYWRGTRVDLWLRRFIEWIGWIILSIVLIYIIYSVIT